MKSFKINKNAEIVCEWVKTRTAFKHTATLLINGEEQDSTKICYCNRTWESFEFESVIKKLLDKTNFLTDKKRRNFLNKISGKAKEEVDAKFKTIAGIARMSEILCPDQKSKNDWKKRMLKAGLKGKGLIMPDDWEDLSEDEKEVKLNGAIKILNQEAV